MSAVKFYTYVQAAGKRFLLPRWLGKSFPAAPRERFPNTVRPLFPVVALAERTVCCFWSRRCSSACRPELTTTSIAGALSSHSVSLGKRLAAHFLHVFAAAGAQGSRILFMWGSAKKKVAGEFQKCERLRPAAPTLESSALPRSSHRTACCGLAECPWALRKRIPETQPLALSRALPETGASLRV